MVNGCPISGPSQRQVAIVDLDGTLLRGNSLRILMRHLLRELRRRGDYATLLRLLGLLAARRLKLVSHKAMKLPFHRLAAEMLRGEALNRFTALLLDNINRPLLAELRRTGMILVIATAAPDVYVGALAAALGFDGSIATPLARRLEEYEESRGERKRHLAEVYAAERGLEIALIATDHEDDLPLLRLPSVTRLLVNPTPRLTAVLDSASLTYLIL